MRFLGIEEADLLITMILIFVSIFVSVNELATPGRPPRFAALWWWFITKRWIIFLQILIGFWLHCDRLELWHAASLLLAIYYWGVCLLFYSNYFLRILLGFVFLLQAVDHKIFFSNWLSFIFILINEKNPRFYFFKFNEGKNKF